VGKKDKRISSLKTFKIRQKEKTTGKLTSTFCRKRERSKKKTFSSQTKRNLKASGGKLGRKDHGFLTLKRKKRGRRQMQRAGSPCAKRQRAGALILKKGGPKLNW